MVWKDSSAGLACPGLTRQSLSSQGYQELGVANGRPGLTLAGRTLGIKTDQTTGPTVFKWVKDENGHKGEFGALNRSYCDQAERPPVLGAPRELEM